jgi:hypothetical protein
MPRAEQLTIQDSSINTPILPFVARQQISRQGSFKPKMMLIPIEVCSEEKTFVPLPQE